MSAGEVNRAGFAGGSQLLQCQVRRKPVVSRTIRVVVGSIVGILCLHCNADDSIEVMAQHRSGAAGHHAPRQTAVVAVYHPETGTYHFRDPAAKQPDLAVRFGAAGDIPLAGSWRGAGVALGIYRPSDLAFHLQEDTGDRSKIRVIPFGAEGDVPVVGDWNGDGVTTIGVWRPSVGTFFLRNSNETGSPDLRLHLGGTGDIPVVGDWDGCGRTHVGVYRPETSTFHLGAGHGGELEIPLGGAGDIPIAGDWNGDGRAGVGLFRPGEGVFYLRSLGHEGASITTLELGVAGDRPLAAAALPIHPDEPIKHREHHALFSLVDPADASHTAVVNGPWESSTTWEHGRVPGPKARVWIPANIEVLRTGTQNGAAQEWVRVDGTLRFPVDRSTALWVETLVIGVSGTLAIGDPSAPLMPEHTATIVFADRGPRDRIVDPYDLLGGLISHGRLSIHGAQVAGHRNATGDLVAGGRDISLVGSLEGWKVGDRLLVPGTTPREEQDEVIEIERVDISRSRVHLTEPMRYSHSAPEGADLPIGNLTRNIRFRSETASPIARRAHFMVMHAQTGVVIDGAAFESLGRTDARAAHTSPVVDGAGQVVPGTDSNTIGRYALHFHLRTGVDRNVAPNTVRNSVIVDSPKHGLVNHGGYVIAEGNVTFGIDGSHFFAENGSEIGSFRGNLAVRSSGSELSRSGDVMSRMYVTDFGHGGHGFWTQGGGVEIVGNYAFGHRAAAYAINAHQMKEEGQLVFFERENYRDQSVSLGGELAQLRAGDVPFFFSGNQAATSFRGLDVWYSQIHAAHAQPSVVENSFFWAIEGHGISTPYTRNVLFRNVTVLGDNRDSTSFGFGEVDDWGEDFVYDGVRAEGFTYGIDLATRGSTTVKNAYLDNTINIRIRAGPGEDLDVLLHNVDFGSSGERDIALEGLPSSMPRVIDGTVGTRRLTGRDGDITPLFGRARVRVEGGNAGLSGSQIYFEEQHFEARPFEKLGIPALAGSTAGEVWHRYGLAIGGALAPRDARRDSRIVGLVGSPVPERSIVHSLDSPFTRSLANHVARARDHAGQIVQSAPVQLTEGWNVVPLPDAGTSLLVFGDTRPPRFEFDPGASTWVHPADLPFGTTIRGTIVDDVGALTARELAVADLTQRVPDPDGTVSVQFPIEDSAGNKTQVKVSLEVREDAVRRARNSVYYLQGSQFGVQLPERRPRTSVAGIQAHWR